MPDDNKFEISGLQDLIKSFTNTAIGDATIPSTLVKAKASYGIPVKLGKITFSVNPNADASLLVFNSKDDLDNPDSDGVLGSSNQKENEIGPQIEFSEKGAWLAYRVRGGVKAAGGGELAGIGLSIEGEKAVWFGDYHFHSDRSEKVGSAIQSDLQQIRLAARFKDIQLLGKNEALTYSVRAKLTTAIEASWSDVFVANVNSLGSYLKTNTPLAIKVDVGANLKLAIGVTDDFGLVFSRHSNGKIRLAVRKSKVSSQTFSAGAGVEVGFADAGPLKEVVERVLEGIAGAAVSEVEKLLSNTSLSSLTDAQKNVFARLLQRLKLDDDLADLLSVREQWKKLKAQVAERIESLAKQKLVAAFKYEYSRVRSDSTLLEVVLMESTLDQLHESLIKASLAETITWCRQNDVVPEKYLHETKLTQKSTWGVSIGIGKFKIGGKDIKSIEEVIQEDWKGNKRIAVLGQRGYQGSWFGQKISWMADFIADTQAFVVAPTLQDFEFGLHLKWLWDEKKLSDSELDRYVDYAQIWRALNNRSEARDAMAPYLKRSAKVSVDLKIDDFALRRLVTLAAAASSDRIFAAMARAMPWEKFEARSIVERRERLYAPVWKAYFHSPEMSYRDLARTTGNILRQLDDGGEVAFLESNISTASGQTSWGPSFAEMVRLNGSQNGNLSGIATDWNRFTEALQTLVPSISSTQSYTVLFKGLKNFYPLCAQSLLLRALGVYFVELAAANGLLSHIERSLSVTPLEGEQLTISLPSSHAAA